MDHSKFAFSKDNLYNLPVGNIETKAGIIAPRISPHMPTSELNLQQAPTNNNETGFDESSSNIINLASAGSDGATTVSGINFDTFDHHIQAKLAIASVVANPTPNSMITLEASSSNSSNNVAPSLTLTTPDPLPSIRDERLPVIEVSQDSNLLLPHNNMPLAGEFYPNAIED